MTGFVEIPFLPRYLLCLDEGLAGTLYGRIYCGYKPEGVKFKDIDQLVLILDEIMDYIGCPQSSTDKRSYGRDKDLISFDRTEKREALKSMQKFDIDSHKGQKATFILQVKFRQNASWQGTIRWVEKKETAHFRSALEFIKIIDSAREQGYQVSVEDLNKKEII